MAKNPFRRLVQRRDRDGVRQPGDGPVPEDPVRSSGGSERYRIPPDYITGSEIKAPIPRTPITTKEVSDLIDKYILDYERIEEDGRRRRIPDFDPEYIKRLGDERMRQERQHMPKLDFDTYHTRNSVTKRIQPRGNFDDNFMKLQADAHIPIKHRHKATEAGVVLYTTDRSADTGTWCYKWGQTNTIVPCGVMKKDGEGMLLSRIPVPAMVAHGNRDRLRLPRFLCVTSKDEQRKVFPNQRGDQFEIPCSQNWWNDAEWKNPAIGTHLPWTNWDDVPLKDRAYLERDVFEASVKDMQQVAQYPITGYSKEMGFIGPAPSGFYVARGCVEVTDGFMAPIYLPQGIGSQGIEKEYALMSAPWADLDSTFTANRAEFVDLYR